MELEAAGHWKLVKERKVPYYERDDLPTECTAFVYKVLKHWITNLPEQRFPHAGKKLDCRRRSKLGGFGGMPRQRFYKFSAGYSNRA